MEASKIHSHLSGRGIAPMRMSASDVKDHAALAGVGININNSVIRNMIAAFGFDGNDVGIIPSPISGVTTPSVTTQIQFLQEWLPGFVQVITAARNIDLLVGLTTAGSFEDEEVVQGIMEPIGMAVPYTDSGNVPLSSWNANFERRTIVRFEQGLSVGRLEELRAARVKINSASEKRNAAAIALEIQRNRVGFYGYNNGANRTYGFLNDPSLPAYVTAPTGAGGSTRWALKTFLEITADWRIAMSALRTQSGDTINPMKAPIVAAIASNAIDSLSITNVQGTQSVYEWIKQNYPNVRIESAPELSDANGGAAVAYFYADTVDDGSTDNRRVFDQIVPSKFFALGVEPRSKSYVEDFANATAGVFVKRPYAVYRLTGI